MHEKLEWLRGGQARREEKTKSGDGQETASRMRSASASVAMVSRGRREEVRDLTRAWSRHATGIHPRENTSPPRHVCQLARSASSHLSKSV